MSVFEFPRCFGHSIFPYWVRLKQCTLLQFCYKITSWPYNSLCCLWNKRAVGKLRSLSSKSFATKISELQNSDRCGAGSGKEPSVWLMAAVWEAFHSVIYEQAGSQWRLFTSSRQAASLNPCTPRLGKSYSPRGPQVRPVSSNPGSALKTQA